MEQTERTYSDAFLRALFSFCTTLVSTLITLESAMRRFHPPLVQDLQIALLPTAERMRQAREAFKKEKTPTDLERFLFQLNQAADYTNKCLDLFISPMQPQQVIPQIMRAMGQHHRAQEALFPLRRILSPINGYFLEGPAQAHLEKYNPEPPSGIDVGLFTEKDLKLHAGGGYSLYIPETYDGAEDRPLVVALHGGSGSGRDFIWAWLREARSRDFLLLSPSSIDRTWSFGGSEDAVAIHAVMQYVFDKWRVNKDRILLTGISDGAIYALIWGLQKDAPFTALAPISGVLHPVDLSHANQKRIYLVHGTLDWMFPVQSAHQAHAALRKAGADIIFREINDLSHTYPREENDRILSWFDPSLALSAK